MGWNARNWCTLGLLKLKDVAQPGMNLREVMKGACCWNRAFVAGKRAALLVECHIWTASDDSDGRLKTATGYVLDTDENKVV